MFWSQFRLITLVPVFLLIILSSYLITRLLKNKSEKAKMLPIQIVTIVLLVLEFFKQLLSIVNGYDLYHIPLHFCSLFLYFLPVAAFYKGKYKEHFRTIAATIAACLFLFMAVYPLLIYPDSDIQSIPAFFAGDWKSYFSLHSVIFHNVALFPFFFFSFGNLCRHDTKRDLKVITLAFAGYAVVSATVANLFSINFNNFKSCNAPFLENVRLSLVGSMGWFGQLIYVLIIGAGTIAVPILAYLVLKLFEKIICSTRTGIIASSVTTGLVAVGLLLCIFNKGIGALICSLVSMVATAMVLPTLINSIRLKEAKNILISSAFATVNIAAIVVEYFAL